MRARNAFKEALIDRAIAAFDGVYKETRLEYGNRDTAFDAALDAVYAETEEILRDFSTEVLVAVDMVLEDYY